MDIIILDKETNKEIKDRIEAIIEKKRKELNSSEAEEFNAN